MSISVTTGIASGIDYEAIIEATLEVEQVEIDRYEAKKEDYKSEISALGEVKSALSSFQDALDELADSWDFFEYSATSSNENILTAQATSSAATGTYVIEVSELAKPEIMMGDDVGSSSDALGYSGTFILNGAEITVEADDSLTDIKNAINNASGDMAGGGVTASIVEVGDGTYALMLTGKESGESITSTDTDGILAALGMATAQEATMAEYSIGNRTITSSSNEIDGLIEGVTLSLKNADPGTTVTVNVTADTGAMTEKAQALVDSYNELIDLLDEYQDAGDEESYGVLFGDATTNNLRANLRNLLFSEFENGDSNITYLSNLGIQMRDDGHLSLDEDTFEEALAEDAEGVRSFFTTQDTGFADVVNDTLDGYLSWDGIFSTKISGLESSADRAQDKIDALEDKLDVFEERLRVRYAALETLLSELTGTQASLSSLLSSLDTGS